MKAEFEKFNDRLVEVVSINSILSHYQDRNHLSLSRTGQSLCDSRGKHRQTRQPIRGQIWKVHGAAQSVPEWHQSLPEVHPEEKRRHCAHIRDRQFIQRPSHWEIRRLIWWIHRVIQDSPAQKLRIQPANHKDLEATGNVERREQKYKSHCEPGVNVLKRCKKWYRWSLKVLQIRGSNRETWASSQVRPTRNHLVAE